MRKKSKNRALYNLYKALHLNLRRSVLTLILTLALLPALGASNIPSKSYTIQLLTTNVAEAHQDSISNLDRSKSNENTNATHKGNKIEHAHKSGSNQTFTQLEKNQDTYKRQKVGLVLCGGGAKGFAHLGVIKALEENNIPIDYIAGTSMGAIIGGLYAIGYDVDQMTELFKSEKFVRWANGEPELYNTRYYYREDDNPTLLSLKFGKTPTAGNDTLRRWRFAIPNSLVHSSPIDLAVMEIFTSSSKASTFNFDSLMIPFFCIASDVTNRKEVVMREGDLGSSIRSSMAFPMVFSPINIDSAVLYDGGLYNNFPWKEMHEIYAPDIIIGSKCVSGNVPIKENDVISVINGLMSHDTDFDMPDSLGFLIDGEYSKFQILEFNRIDEIAQIGYNETIKQIEKIKERYGSTSDNYSDILREKRENFRRRCKDIRIYKDVNVEGDISDGTKRFISRTARLDNRENFSFNQFKQAYYRITESGLVTSFYPTYYTKQLPDGFKSALSKEEKNKNIERDSLLYLRVKASKAVPFSFSLGGNISTSSLNQIYVGASYIHAGMNPWRASIGSNFGKFYRAFAGKFRHDIGIRPLAYYYIKFTAHQFDYFNGNQALLNSNKLPKNIQLKEFYSTFGITTPILFSRNTMVELSANIGRVYQSSFLEGVVDSHLTPDKGNSFVVSPRLSIVENRYNYAIYPTSGSNNEITLGYYFMNETFTPGSTNNSAHRVSGVRHHQFFARGTFDNYIKINHTFSIGIGVDLSWRKLSAISNYYTAITSSPAFSPTVHSNTLLLENYRAPSFIAGSLSPIINIKRGIYIHSTIAWFQPYKKIVKSDDSSSWEYSNKFPHGASMANLAIVWQTPIGPLSVSTSYYSKGNHKWYPQLNFGYLIFNKKLHER